MTAFDEVANQSAQPLPESTGAGGRRGRFASDEWRSRSHELKEEFFALMDQLADGEISASQAKVETDRINRDMATLIKLTLTKRD